MLLTPNVQNGLNTNDQDPSDSWIEEILEWWSPQDRKGWEIITMFDSEVTDFSASLVVNSHGSRENPAFQDRNIVVFYVVKTIIQGGAPPVMFVGL